MIRFLKYLVLAVLTLVGGFFLIGIILGLIFFRSASDCSGDSKSAEYVRSLSSQRLSKLYDDMEKFYYMNQESPYKEYSIYGETAVPKEFSDLKVISIRPGRVHIKVVGCFDNYMYLYFNGIREPGEKEIVLQYGEHEVIKEKIWSN